MVGPPLKPPFGGLPSPLAPPGRKGVVPAAIATFTEGFDAATIAPDIWFSTNDSGATTTQSGGQLLITIPLATPGIYGKLTSFALRSLIGSAAFVQMTPPTGAFTTFGVEVHFRLQSPNQNYLLRWMWTSDGFIQADYAIGGVAFQVGNITYSATSHKWLQMREAAGTIFWETAPDNGGAPGTWTQQFSKTIASLNWSPEQLAASFWCGEFQSPGANVTGPAKFDGFNTVTTTDSFSVTGTESPSDQATGTLDPVADISGTPTEYPVDTIDAEINTVVPFSISGTPTEYPSDTSTGVLDPNVGATTAVTEFPSDTSTASVDPIDALSGTPTEYPDDTAAGSISSTVAVSGVLVEYPDDTAAGSISSTVAVSAAPKEYPDDTSTGSIGPIGTLSGASVEYPDDTATGTLEPIVAASVAATESPDDTADGLIVPVSGVAVSVTATEDPDTTSGAIDSTVDTSTAATEELDTASGALDPSVDASVSVTEDPDTCVSLVDFNFAPPTGKSHTDLSMRQWLIEYYEREWTKKEPAPPKQQRTKVFRAVEELVYDAPSMLEPRIAALIASQKVLREAMAAARTQVFSIELPSLPVAMVTVDDGDDEDEELLMLSMVL